MFEGNNEERRSLDEAYLCATNSSNLTLNPDRICAATHLIAAGLLGNRMADRLVHLRAAWDTGRKPRKATEAEIEARALELPKRNGKLDIKRARTEMLVAYAVAMRRRAHATQGWVEALSVLAEWAILRKVDMDLLSPALYHWLAPTCPVCDGHGVRKGLYGTGGKEPQCFHCNGQREPGVKEGEGPTIWPRPLGAEKIHTWLKGCVGKAKAERGGWLHGQYDATDLRERTANRKGPAPLVEDEAADAAAREHFARSMDKTREQG